jgi:hypothetical protein
MERGWVFPSFMQGREYVHTVFLITRIKKRKEGRRKKEEQGEEKEKGREGKEKEKERKRVQLGGNVVCFIPYYISELVDDELMD